MRRAVIILHPSFDLPGAAGVSAAMEYAEQLQKSSKQLAEVMRQNGAKAADVREVEKQIADFGFHVRKLDKDMF